MNGKLIFVLLGLAPFGAYALGYQSAPVGKVAARSMTSPAGLVESIALSGSASSSKDVVPEKPDGPGTKRRVEVALTAAAIAAIIVQASRDQYHAGGRPCACPDDTMRNGGSCGGRSAYSRPGGASPLCYPSDVPAAMIESYRQRTASRETHAR